MLFHAAVVARGMGKCCVSGAGSLRIDYKARTVETSGKVFSEGDWISLNGSTGEVFEGKVKTKEASIDKDFAKIMELSDKYTRMYVRTNADTPKDARIARNFGAKGIGLCRTEHMNTDTGDLHIYQIQNFLQNRDLYTLLLTTAPNSMI